MSDLQCPARIILARHGETEYESDRVGTQGGSLTEAGREQARRLGAELRGRRVAQVFASHLSRAVQTAEIAAGVLGVEVVVREGLGEFDVGDMLGQPYDASVADPVMSAWRRGDLAAAFPGGETGEQTCDRVLPVLGSIADGLRGETALVVSHGGVMLALLGRMVADPAGTGEMANCSFIELEADADGWRLP